MFPGPNFNLRYLQRLASESLIPLLIAEILLWTGHTFAAEDNEATFGRAK